jgi:hypothetical protein
VITSADGKATVQPVLLCLFHYYCHSFALCQLGSVALSETVPAVLKVKPMISDSNIMCLMLGQSGMITGLQRIHAVGKILTALLCKPMYVA